MTRCAPYMIPADIDDFVRLWPELKHNLALAVLVAWIKVPHVRARFLKALRCNLAQEEKQTAPISAAALLAGFESAMRAEATVRPLNEEEESKVIGRVGSMRTLGLAACCRAVDIGVPCTPKQASTLAASQGQRLRRRSKTVGESDVVVLGSSRRQHMLRRNLSKLEDLAALAEVAPPAPDVLDANTLEQFTSTADGLVGLIGECYAAL